MIQRWREGGDTDTNLHKYQILCRVIPIKEQDDWRIGFNHELRQLYKGLHVQHIKIRRLR